MFVLFISAFNAVFSFSQTQIVPFFENKQFFLSDKFTFITSCCCALSCQSGFVIPKNCFQQNENKNFVTFFLFPYAFSAFATCQNSFWNKKQNMFKSKITVVYKKANLRTMWESWLSIVWEFELCNMFYYTQTTLQGSSLHAMSWTLRWR